MFRSFLGALLCSLALIGGANAQTCSIPNNLTNGTNADATQVMANFNALLNCINTAPPPPTSTPPRSYLTGLALSTAGGSATFAVAVGAATSDDTTTSIKLSTTPFSKTTGAWAVGSGNGSLDTGAIANNTWYHVYLIERTDTGVVDVLTSLSASAPTLPTSYSVKRRIGSMKTDGSSHWTAFTQNGDEFLWVTPIADAVGFSLTTTASLFTLSVPTGVQVWSKISTIGGSAATWTYIVTSPDQADTAPVHNSLMSMEGVAGNFAGTEQNVRTSTSAQIRARSDIAGGLNFYITTFGWLDRRGRDN